MIISLAEFMIRPQSDYQIGEYPVYRIIF